MIHLQTYGATFMPKFNKQTKHVLQIPHHSLETQSGLQIQNTINKLMHFVSQIQNTPRKQILHISK